jgi:hypothetical protein
LTCVSTGRAADYKTVLLGVCLQVLEMVSKIPSRVQASRLSGKKKTKPSAGGDVKNVL